MPNLTFCTTAETAAGTTLYYEAPNLLSPSTLGVDPTVPVLPRCGRLLSMATVAAHFPWDWAVVCGRLEAKQGGTFPVPC